MSGTTEIPPKNQLGVAAWALYDWANSAFPTVIITFVFATQGIVQDDVAGTVSGLHHEPVGLAVALVTLY